MLLYLAANLALISQHEPWRDEAQAWMLARDLPIWRLPSMMSYEGHPIFWHLLIYPMAHLGGPIILQNFLALSLMGLAVALLLAHRQLPDPVKYIFIFSPFMMYFYPVVARSYALIPAILFGLALAWPIRRKHPLIYGLLLGLLVQTHVILIMTAFGLSLCYMVEVGMDFLCWKKKQGCSQEADSLSSRGSVRDLKLGILALCMPLLSVLSLIVGFTSGETSSYLDIKVNSLATTLKKIFLGGEAIMGRLYAIYGKDAAIALCLIMAASVAYIGLCLYICKRRGISQRAPITAGIVLIFTLGFQGWMDAMVYTFSLQKLYTAIYVYAWVIMITADIWNLGQQEEAIEDSGRTEGLAGGLVLVGLAVVSSLALIASWDEVDRDVDTYYSNGPEAAAFIAQNIPEEAIILTDNQAEVSSILPYLPGRSFIYAPNGTHFTYVVWDSHWLDRMDYDDLAPAVEGYVDGDRPIYFISNINVPYIEDRDRLDEDYELVYESNRASVKDEDYRIYRLR